MLAELLTSLKMKGALSALNDIESIKDKHDYTLALLKAEQSFRTEKAMQRRLYSAKFPVQKSFCDIEPSLNPKVDYKAIQKLCDSDFIKEKKNLCLMGKQGTGKTHSLIALGRILCSKGYTTRFYTGCGLVNELEEAKANQCLTKLMKSILKPNLLIIDELGFVPFSENGARLLFDVFASRYEKGSIAVTTNLSFDKWAEVFGSVELTAALIDRFTHNANIFTFEGVSVRYLQAQKNKKRRK
jgi:DNA replication protein DnaC